MPESEPTTPPCPQDKEDETVRKISSLLVEHGGIGFEEALRQAFRSGYSYRDNIDGRRIGVLAPADGDGKAELATLGRRIEDLKSLDRATPEPPATPEPSATLDHLLRIERNASRLEKRVAEIEKQTGPWPAPLSMLCGKHDVQGCEECQWTPGAWWRAARAKDNNLKSPKGPETAEPCSHRSDDAE